MDEDVFISVKREEAKRQVLQNSAQQTGKNKKALKIAPLSYDTVWIVHFRLPIPDKNAL